jgi:hypothetical protein
MGFREDYDRLIEMLATQDRADDVLVAKEEFWRLTGKIHGGEPLFEARTTAFFEWYLFDRKVNGGTLFEDYLIQDPAAWIYQGFLKNIHSIFIVKRITSNGMKVKDLFANAYYFLDGDNVSLGFYKGALFEGRILSYEGRLYLSPAVCLHPRDSKGIIEFVLKMARKRGETVILPLIHRLSYMNLKWETYRNIKVKDIYKFEEYENRRWWNRFFGS